MERRSWGSTEHLAAEFLSSSLSHQDARAHHLALVTAAIRKEFRCSTTWKLTELLHLEPALLGVRCSDPKPMQPQEIPAPEPREQSHTSQSGFGGLGFFHSLCPRAQSCSPSRGWWDPAELPLGVPFPR